MICNLYDKLSPRERVEFIGKLVHAAQSDELCFLEASMIITHAEEKGVFDGVKLLPEGDEPLIS